MAFDRPQNLQDLKNTNILKIPNIENDLFRDLFPKLFIFEKKNVFHSFDHQSL